MSQEQYWKGEGWIWATSDAAVTRVNPEEQAEYRWVTSEGALALPHYCGLKDPNARWSSTSP